MDTVQSKPAATGNRPLEKHLVYSVEQALNHLTRLRPEAEQRLYVVTDEVLFNIWDALCISINQNYRDEYLPYLPHVFDLLKNTRDGRDIVDYLLFIEENVIGTLPGDNLAIRRATSTVDILLAYRNSILNTEQEQEAF